MASLLIALTLAALSLVVVISLQISFRRLRRARLKTLELTPNCLLTRYPIVFLAAPKTLFRLFDHWNEVPAFLREHGYEVLIIEPPTRDLRASLAAIESLKTRVHVIAETSQNSVLRELARRQLPQVVSLTLVTARTRPRPAVASVADLKPLALPIETVAIEVLPHELAGGWQTWLARLLHDRSVDGFATAFWPTRLPWSIESKFLELAVALAERDVQGTST